MPGGQSPAVRIINDALGGVVIDVLAELVPEVGRLPRRRALERIIDDIDLLDRCLTAFRQNPDRFSLLLVDPRRRPVRRSDEMLLCGRSLDQVVAMVVRTAAKRYFRRHIDGWTRPLLRPRGRAANSLLALHLMAMVAIAGLRPARSGRGKALYEVLQDYLRHDWQVPLVPEYARLTPALVRRLGPRILDFHAAADLRRLQKNPEFVPKAMAAAKDEGEGEGGSTAAPAAISGATRGKAAPAPEPAAQRVARDDRARLEDLVSSDGLRLRSAAFKMVMLDPEVRATLPDPGAEVRVTDALNGVGVAAVRAMTEGLGLRLEQIAVLLLSVRHTLGSQHFTDVFGVPGRPAALAGMVSRAKAAGIDNKTPLHVVADLARAGFPAPPAKR
jgi:hypothetical protein